MVVVDLWIATTKIGENGLYTRQFVELGFDETQRAVGLGEARARRCIDLYQKLRCICFGEQARSEYGYEQEREQQ